MEKNKGVKFDQGKPRHELLPLMAIDGLAEVFTYGAAKYEDRNWEKGIKWSRLIGAANRHLKAFEKGQDFDEESGLLHLSHAMANLAMLIEYYKIFPQGDDRGFHFAKTFRIGLDIDEVLADFIGHYTKRFDIKLPVECWNFDPDIKKNIETLKHDEEFWSTIPRKIDPSTIPFEPVCYITSRPCNVEVTRRWIHDNGFPNVPIYCVESHGSKVQYAKDAKLDIFVDDRFENFEELNKNGICCFLLDAPHNRRYDVGYKRISSLAHFKNMNNSTTPFFKPPFTRTFSLVDKNNGRYEVNGDVIAFTSILTACNDPKVKIDFTFDRCDDKAPTKLFFNVLASHEDMFVMILKERGFVMK